jgi:autotransporter-associated beta strand protein
VTLTFSSGATVTNSGASIVFGVPTQNFVWGGTGSTTATSDYALATNWSSPGSAPPFLAGQSATFGATGSSTVVVDLSHLPAPFLQPNSWTFSANAQSAYSISGDAVAFSVAGPTGGVINNANAGQTITIANNINDGFSGSIIPVMVQQLGNSTLVLAGANGYSGGTLISAGIVQVTNANSLGTGTVTLNGGTLQMQSPTLTSVNFSNNFAINAPGGTVDLNGAFVTLSGVISDGAGAGVLSVIDSSGSGSTLELSSANTYTGGTNANAVTLAVDNNSSVGTGTVTLNNAIFQANSSGNLAFANNFSLSGSNIFDANGVTLTIAGNVTGAGSLEVANSGGSSGFAPGTVVMLGTNAYTGGTLICSCSTLQLGDATHTASIIGVVDNEGAFNIVNANTSGIKSILNDGGITTFLNSSSASSIAITNQFGGETDFKDTSTAGSAVIINRGSGGFTTFSNSASAQNANITNQSGSSTVFLGNSSAGNAFITNKSGGGFFSDAVFGGFGGGISLPGLGFFGNSTAANATIVNDGSHAVIAFGFPPGMLPSDFPLIRRRRATPTSPTRTAAIWSSTRLQPPVTPPSPR